MADPGYRWSDGHPQRRAAFVARMARGETFQCGCDGAATYCLGHHGPTCPVILADGGTFHLGHRVALKHDGDGADSTPWCPGCNLRGAAWLTNHPNNASRNWWA